MVRPIDLPRCIERASLSALWSTSVATRIPEPDDYGSNASHKCEQQSGQLHQSADQRADVLRMMEAIGGAGRGEDPNPNQSGKKEAEYRGPRPSRGEVHHQADCRQDRYSWRHFRMA
jgi:hypothetical protein